MKIILAALAAMLLFVSSGAHAAYLEPRKGIKAVRDWKRVALVEVIITPPDVAFSMSMVGRAVYSNVQNSLADEIIEIHKDRIDRTTEGIGDAVSRLSKCEVLYGKKLIASADYRNLARSGVKTFTGRLDNRSYPEIIVQNGALNFFNFNGLDTRSPSGGGSGQARRFEDIPSEGSLAGSGNSGQASPAEMYQTPFAFFETYTDYGPNMGALCRALRVDGVIFATVTVQAYRLNAWGNSSYRCLVLDMYFVDAKGEKVLMGNINTHDDSRACAPWELKYYLRALDLAPRYAELLLQEVYR